MDALLTRLRQRYPQHWCMRLMLGVAVLGLLLGSATVKQIHVHADAGPGHSHEHVLHAGHDDGGTTAVPDAPASGSLHMHDGAGSPSILGSIGTFAESRDLVTDWVPSEDLSLPPLATPGAPHRPPIV